MLGYSYSYIVGLEGASELRSDQPCRRSISKGDEFNKAALRRQPLHWNQQLLHQQQGRMVLAPPTIIPRLRPVRVPKLAQASAPSLEWRLLSQSAAADATDEKIKLP